MIALLGADVEESGDGAANAVGLIVNEGIEETGVAVQGDDIVIGDGCRDQGAMALPENNFMVHGEGVMVKGEGFMVHGEFMSPWTNDAVTLNAHGDDEAVVFSHVTMEGFGDFHHTDIEIGGIYDLHSPVGGLWIVCAVVLLYMEVKGLSCLFRMEFTGLAIHARTIVVKDTVCHIGGLLYLGEQDATTDGMDTTCREIKHITCLDLVVSKDFRDGAILYPLLVFVGCDGLLEAGVEMGTLVSADDVPHLGLAHLPMFTHGHLIIGMDLYAQVFLRIDELHQQRKLTMILLVDCLTKDLLWMVINH